MILVLLYLIWLIAASTGFVMSIICLSYDGTIGSKIAGFLLSIFLGPFYWLYYIYSINY
jgi:hypothetical protein